jgi:hypothetical protein
VLAIERRNSCASDRPALDNRILFQVVCRLPIGVQCHFEMMEFETTVKENVALFEGEKAKPCWEKEIRPT